MIHDLNSQVYLNSYPTPYDHHHPKPPMRIMTIPFGGAPAVGEGILMQHVATYSLSRRTLAMGDTSSHFQRGTNDDPAVHLVQDPGHTVT